MPSGSLSLATRWDETVVLTKNPQITFFKIVYKRHTCFAIESIQVDFNEDLDFGVETNCTIGPLGDLINKMYLCITLPEININTTNTVPTHIATAKTYTTDMYTTFKAYLGLVMEHYNHFNNGLKIQNNTFQNMYMTNQINNNYKDTFDAFTSHYTQFNDHMVTNKSLFNFTTDTTFHYGAIHDWEIKSLDNTLLPLTVTTINATTTLTDREKLAQLQAALVAFKRSIDVHYKKIHSIQIFFTDMYHYHLQRKFAWTSMIGHSIIDKVELSISGTVVQSFTSQTLEILNALYESKPDNYAEMVGNVSQLTTLSTHIAPYILYIPLPFWFTKDSTISLPISSIPYSQLEITVKLKRLDQCCFSEVPITASFNPSIKHACLYVDYVYLGNEERTRFAQTGIDYIIECMEMETKTIDNSIMELLFHLETKIVKECMWCVVDETVESEVKSVNFNTLHKLYQKWTIHPTLLPTFTRTGHNDGHTDLYHRNKRIYTINNHHYEKGVNCINTVAIMLKGAEAGSTFTGTYYDSVVPRQFHRITSSGGLYVYSFSLYPASIQPSGHCDFTNIESMLLKIHFNDTLDLTHSNVLRFYTNELRVLRVMNGKAQLL